MDRALRARRAPTPYAGDFAHPGAAAPAGQPPVTPADAADAARLVSFGLQPKLLPARDAEYADLLRRYREESAFARLADAVATGLGLIVLEVSPRAGMAVTAGEDSVFAVRMGDYARRASSDAADRFLHGLAHLAVAALAFPRPEDLADDAYIGRITVNGVDAFVRQACHRLEERAEEQGDNTDPASDAPGLEAGWRIYARRSSTGATKDAHAARRIHHRHHRQGRRLPHRLRLPPAHRRRRGRRLPHHRPLPAPVRDLAGGAAMAELLELGVVPVTDGSATLLPPPDPDSMELAADAGLPFHS